MRMGRGLAITQAKVTFAEDRAEQGSVGAGRLQAPRQLNIQLCFHSQRLPFLFLSFTFFSDQGKITCFWV